MACYVNYDSWIILEREVENAGEDVSSWLNQFNMNRILKIKF